MLMSGSTVEPCPFHPEKVRKDNIINALDGLIQRLGQPGSHIRKTYKCKACWHWHYTSRSWGYTPPTSPARVFPRPYIYGVEVDGQRVWQSPDQPTAQRKARELRGEVVPYMKPYK
jgi:hypothetical protein